MSETGARDYEVVTVAYRSRPLVEAFLEALDPGVPVAVVDNAQGADGLEGVVARRPAARYLVGPGRGYAAGANLGASTSTRSKVIFVSPDAFPSVEVLDALAAGFDDDPYLAEACALDVEPDGRGTLGTGGWEPSIPRALAHAVGLHKLLPTSGLWAHPEPDRPVDVDWLGGAVVAVRSDLFARLGRFDESFFVYNEDVAFGRTVREAGLHMRLRTDLIVPTSARGSGDSRPRMLRQRGASLMQYLRRHHPRVRVESIRVVLSLAITARTLLTRLRNDHGQTEEHHAYVRGMWTGPPPR